MNKFEKVSAQSYYNSIDGALIPEEYNAIKLPKRATTGSAGYDFFSPIDFELKVGETIKIPTGIRVQLDEDKVLQCYPRSGLGFKYRLQLNNVVGIIDSDYFYSDNEGHIFAKLTNCGTEKEGQTVHIKQGEAFMQGIIMQYFTTVNDETDGIRNGGMGSTSK